jgi:hypothetical protein
MGSLTQEKASYKQNKAKISQLKKKKTPQTNGH